MAATDAEILRRITVDPEICHGKPCVRGLRYPVALVLDLLSGGMTRQQVLDDYPDLEPADIDACLHFAARLADVKSVGKAAS